MISTIIHMGLPKTGSTSIQAFFDRNRDILKSNGMLYSSSLGAKAHNKLLALAQANGYKKFDPYYCSDNREAIRESVIKELRHEIEGSQPNRIILSCEGMPTGSVANFRQLRIALQSCGMRIDKVLLYLRPQVEWRRSVIQQRIKVGIWSDDKLYPVDDPKSCGVYGCYRDHVERRAAVFGMETISLRLFGPEYFKDGDFYRDIREAFELPELPYEMAAPSNESLSDFACQMLMHLNKSLPRYKSDGKECPLRLRIRKLTAKYFTASGSGALGKASPSGAICDQYEKYYKKSNEWIRKNFFPNRDQLFVAKTYASSSDKALHHMAIRAKEAAERILTLRESASIEKYFSELQQELSVLSFPIDSQSNAVLYSMDERKSKKKSDYQTQSYWKRRSGMIYYRYIEKIIEQLGASAQSMIDVGSGNCPYMEWFDWIPERVSVDIRVPYSSEHVKGIQGDIFKLKFPKRFDICTCLQVLEHVPDAKEFSQRLLQLGQIVVVSVPYKWPNTPKPTPGHVHDPVDYTKLTAWIGREADYKIVVEEPLYSNPKSRRLIAVYANNSKTYKKALENKNKKS
jgi:hypothetical protein